MRLKTCWLNKSLIWSDLKRFWYLGVLNLLATFFFGIFPSANSMRYTTLSENAMRTIMPVELTFGYFLGIVFAVFLTARLFAYLNKPASVAFSHALPLSRKTQFVSRISAALLLSFASGMINALLLFLYRMDPKFAQTSPYLSLKFLAVYLIYSLGAISLTAFAQMLTGSSIACLFFTGAFVAIPAAIEGFIRTFLENHIYGYYADYEEFFTAKLFYLMPEQLLSWRCLIYIILSAILLTAAYFLYKHRPLERSGEVVAFRTLRTVFIYAVAVFAGMVSYLYFGSLFSGCHIFYLLPFGLLGLVVAFMISHKSFRLKGVQYPLLIFTALVGLLYLCVRFDITGYERRVPRVEDIAYIHMEDGDRLVADYYSETLMMPYSEEPYPVYYDDPFEASVYDRENIEHYVALHSYMSKKAHGTSNVNVPDYEATNYYDGFQRIPIEYHLKNGRVMRRVYWADKLEDKEYLSPVTTSASYRASYEDILDGTEKTITSVVISDERLGTFAGFERAGNQRRLYAVDDESIDRITQALKEDLLNASYENDLNLFQCADTPLTEIYMTIEVPVHNEQGEKEKPARFERYYYVWPFYTRTVAVLQDMGLYDALLKAEEVDYISVPMKEDQTVLKLDYYPMDGEPWFSSEYQIKDRSQIEEIYASIDSQRGIFYRDFPQFMMVRIVYRSGYMFDVLFDLNRPDCPNALKALE